MTGVAAAVIGRRAVVRGYVLKTFAIYLGPSPPSSASIRTVEKACHGRIQSRTTEMSAILMTPTRAEYNHVIAFEVSKNELVVLSLPANEQSKINRDSHQFRVMPVDFGQPRCQMVAVPNFTFHTWHAGRRR